MTIIEYVFKIVNALFTNKDYINSLTQETARQTIFMVRRRLAIKYPLQVQVFNNNPKVNPLDELKFWSDFLYTGYAPPEWTYVKGKLQSQHSADSKRKVSEASVTEYCKRYDISKKDVESALRFYPEEMIKEIKEFEKLKKQLGAYEENN